MGRLKDRWLSEKSPSTDPGVIVGSSQTHRLRDRMAGFEPAPTTEWEQDDTLAGFEQSLEQRQQEIFKVAKGQQEANDIDLSGLGFTRGEGGAWYAEPESEERSAMLQQRLGQVVGDRFRVRRIQNRGDNSVTTRIEVPSGETFAFEKLEELAKERSRRIEKEAAPGSAQSFGERALTSFRGGDQTTAVQAQAGAEASVVPRYDDEGQKVGLWVRKHPGDQYQAVDPDDGAFGDDISGDIADMAGGAFRALAGGAGSLVGGVMGARRGMPIRGAMLGGAAAEAGAEALAQGISKFAVPGDEDPQSLKSRLASIGFAGATGAVAELAGPALGAAKRAVGQALPGAAARATKAATTRAGLGLVERTGVPLSVSQITGGRLSGSLESLVRQMPFSSGPTHAADVNRIVNIGRHVQKTVEHVAKGDVDPGSAARLVGGAHDRWVREAVGAAGDDFGAAMNRATLAVRNERVIPMGLYIDKLKRLRGELDSFTSGGSLEKAQREIDNLLEKIPLDRNGLPRATPREFQNSLHTLREQAQLKGGLFEWLEGRKGKRHTKELLSSLHDDLDRAVEHGGVLGEAADEISGAHARYRQAFEQIDESRTVLLEDLAGRIGGKESAGKDVTSMARDVLKATPEQIERTMTVGKRVAPDEIDAFKGSALKEFFDSAGHQGDISPRKLVTQYSKKGKQIKALLGDDKEAIQMVEDIVEVAKRVGERPGANPSGTAPMITLAMSMWGIQSLDPATMAKVGSAALGTRLFAHGVNHPAGRSVLKMMLDPPGAAIGTPLGRQQFSHLILQLAKSMEESENE